LWWKGREHLFSKHVAILAAEPLGTDLAAQWGSETQPHSSKAEAKRREPLQANRF